VVLALFVVAGAVRLGGSWRQRLARYGPTAAMAALALGAVMMGRWGVGLGFAVLAFGLGLGAGLGALWRWPPSGARPVDPARVAAARVLGVSPNASPETIRAAYRDAMRTAHPDAGGDPARAAALVAARDLLLRQ
jgi:DnaJ-domain-containing protein 1